MDKLQTPSVRRRPGFDGGPPSYGRGCGELTTILSLAYIGKNKTPGGTPAGEKRTRLFVPPEANKEECEQQNNIKLTPILQGGFDGVFIGIFELEAGGDATTKDRDFGGRRKYGSEEVAYVIFRVLSFGCCVHSEDNF